MQKYVAIANFTLNLDNGTKQLNVQVGDELGFDGLYVECKGEKGTARPLGKVIGEWIRPVNGAQIVRAASTVPSPSAKSRNATGGRILEASDISQDADTARQQESSHDELKRLVNQYDTTPAPMNISDRVTDDMVDMRKESRVQVDNQDAQEVAKVSTAAKTGAEKNNSNVTVQAQQKKKATVISHEERVVKKTDYTKKATGPAQEKHLKVDKEGGGVEVRKVSAPTTTVNVVKSATVESRMEVSNDQDAVIETNYGSEMRTEVGSSTQAKIEQDVILKKAPSPVQVKREVIREASQDGVVVGKVKKIPEASMTTQDGITSRVTVSSGGQASDGAVTFSSNADIDEGEATFSGSDDAIADLGGGGDIDVNDILDNV